MLPSPRWRLSPHPSCPLEFRPQHLTLPSSCGQQPASLYTRGMGPDACRVLLSALHRSLHVSAAVLGLYLARATAAADMNPRPRLYRLCISNPASPVWRRCLADAVQEQCLSEFCCGSDLCGISLSPVNPALPPHQHHSRALPLSSYQQRARVVVSSGDRDSRSARSQRHRRKMRPHLCGPNKHLSRHCPIHHLQSSKRHTLQMQVRRMIGNYRCFRRRDSVCRRTRAAHSSRRPST